ELEVLGPGARGDVDDPGALVQLHLAPWDDAVHDVLLRRQLVERAFVLEPDELRALDDAVELAVLLREPPTAVAQAVVGVRLDRGRDVRRQRPRRRRPDDER